MNHILFKSSFGPLLLQTALLGLARKPLFSVGTSKPHYFSPDAVNGDYFTYEAEVHPDIVSAFEVICPKGTFSNVSGHVKRAEIRNKARDVYNSVSASTGLVLQSMIAGNGSLIDQILAAKGLKVGTTATPADRKAAVDVLKGIPRSFREMFDNYPAFIGSFHNADLAREMAKTNSASLVGIEMIWEALGYKAELEKMVTDHMTHVEIGPDTASEQGRTFFSKRLPDFLYKPSILGFDYDDSVLNDFGGILELLGGDFVPKGRTVSVTSTTAALNYIGSICAWQDFLDINSWAEKFSTVTKRGDVPLDDLVGFIQPVVDHHAMQLFMSHNVFIGAFQALAQGLLTSQVLDKMREVTPVFANILEKTDMIGKFNSLPVSKTFASMVDKVSVPTQMTIRGESYEAIPLPSVSYDQKVVDKGFDMSAVINQLVQAISRLTGDHTFMAAYKRGAELLGGKTFKLRTIRQDVTNIPLRTVGWGNLGPKSDITTYHYETQIPELLNGQGSFSHVAVLRSPAKGTANILPQTVGGTVQAEKIDEIWWNFLKSKKDSCILGSQIKEKAPYCGYIPFQIPEGAVMAPSYSGVMAQHGPVNWLPVEPQSTTLLVGTGRINDLSTKSRVVTPPKSVTQNLTHPGDIVGRHFKVTSFAAKADRSMEKSHIDTILGLNMDDLIRNIKANNSLVMKFGKVDKDKVVLHEPELATSPFYELSTKGVWVTLQRHSELNIRLVALTNVASDAAFKVLPSSMTWSNFEIMGFTLAQGSMLWVPELAKVMKAPAVDNISGWGVTIGDK